MGDVYVLEQPCGPPTAPTCWSWSGLKAWRQCPRQWWLLRATYANAPTPYPQPLNPGAAAGTILHAVVSDFLEYLKQADESATDQDLRAAFNVRRAIQSRLREIAASLTNPRTDGQRLLARVSVDDCVNAFRQVAPSCLAVGRGPRSRKRSTAQPKERTIGSEVWIEVPDPPLCGRLDLSTGEGLIDFKTGDPADNDVDQLRFYALLVWLRTGSIPSKLTVMYVHSGKRVDVLPPSIELLQESVRSYKDELAGIAAAISEGAAPAVPSQTNCSLCAVRQLCSAYWSAHETAALRLTEHATKPYEGWRGWLDVEVSRLPECNHTKGYTGTGSVSGLGDIHLSIGPSKVHAKSPKRARLLNALVEHRGENYSVTASATTEVFWMEDVATNPM